MRKMVAIRKIDYKLNCCLNYPHSPAPPIETRIDNAPLANMITRLVLTDPLLIRMLK